VIEERVGPSSQLNLYLIKNKREVCWDNCQPNKNQVGLGLNPTNVLSLRPNRSDPCSQANPTHKLKVHLDHANFVKEIRPCLGS